MAGFKTYDEWFNHKLDQFGNWVWNDTGVDIIQTDSHKNPEVAIQQTLDFFSQIDAPNLKEGTVRELFSWEEYESSTQAILDMLWMEEDAWVSVIGQNGKKIYAGLQAKMNQIPLHVFAGSTSYFGRGVGRRKLKALFTSLSITSLDMLSSLTESQILSVHGFEEKTAVKVLVGIPKFIEFVSKLPKYVTFMFNYTKKVGGILSGSYVMTGFRDKQLEQTIERLGGENGGTVSRKTTMVVAADPDSNSGKVKRAKELNIPVMSLSDFLIFLREFQ